MAEQNGTAEEKKPTMSYELDDQLRFADGNPAAVLMLDREHAGRAHVTPAE